MLLPLNNLLCIFSKSLSKPLTFRKIKGGGVINLGISFSEITKIVCSRLVSLQPVRSASIETLVELSFFLMIFE